MCSRVTFDSLCTPEEADAFRQELEVVWCASDRASFHCSVLALACPLSPHDPRESRERWSRRLWSLECAGPCCLQAGRHGPPVQPLQVRVPRRAHVAPLRAARRADAPLHCARVWAASLHRHAAADLRLLLRGTGRPAGCVTRHTERQGTERQRRVGPGAHTSRDAPLADSPTCR